MSVLFVLLPVALLFSGVALLAFIWAARAGQFDDLETPGLRVLHEEGTADAPDGDRHSSPPSPRDPEVWRGR